MTPPILPVSATGCSLASPNDRQSLSEDESFTSQPLPASWDFDCAPKQRPLLLLQSCRRTLPPNRCLRITPKKPILPPLPLPLPIQEHYHFLASQAASPPLPPHPTKTESQIPVNCISVKLLSPSFPPTPRAVRPALGASRLHCQQPSQWYLLSSSMLIHNFVLNSV